MPVIIGFSSQKGGCAKSTLARALAVESIRAGLVVDVVDMDVGQATVFEWSKDRAAAGHEPHVPVRLAPTLEEALDASIGADLVIIDSPGKVDLDALALARRADLIVQPSNAGLDDLRPAIRTFNGLCAQGIPKHRLLLALARIGSESEQTAARGYIGDAGYAVADGYLPERVSYRSLHNTGLAVTEASRDSLRGAAESLIQNIIDRAMVVTEENVR